MRRMVSANQIVGKTIVGFDAGPFDNGRGGTAHKPSITLNDGTTLLFITEETDVADYGTFIGRYPKFQQPD